MSNLENVSQQLRRLGIEVAPQDLRIDGRIHRVPVDGQGRSKKNGWYVLYTMYLRNGDMVITGSYGNWATGESATIELEKREWSDEEKRDYAERMAAARQAAQDEQVRLHEECRKRANTIWSKLPESGASPYLRRKKIKAYDVRFSRDNVIVPLYNPAGELVSLQFIAADGSKKFLTGTPKRGNFHVIPCMEALRAQARLGNAGSIDVCEGYATAASVYAARGGVVVVAFDAGNLGVVAAGLRQQYPDAEIVICGDSDVSGMGQKAARDAAEAVNGSYRLPVFQGGPDKQHSDWNDLHCTDGLHAVRRQLENNILTREPDAASVVSPPLTTETPEPSHSQPETERPSGKPAAPSDTFGRYTDDDLLDNFSLIYGTDTVWDTREHLQMRLSHLRHIVGRDAYKRWDDDPRRKIARGLMFEPSGILPPHYINLFRGFPLTPTGEGREGCARIREHIYNLAGRRTEEYQFLLQWIAYPLQHPGAKMDSSVIMYGAEGPGKSVLWERVVSSIYGEYATTIGQSQLESQFTGWQSGKLFALCEEVVSRAERSQHKGQLKHLVTGKTLMINEKNLPLREEQNHINFVFLSNSTVPLEIDNGDRRYMVLYTDKVPTGDYFRLLFEEINNGGIQAFYSYLMSLDLGDFNDHTQPPLNQDKRNLIAASLPSPVLFLDEWRDGHLGLPYCSCAKGDLFREYVRWCEHTNEFKKRERDFVAEIRRHLKEGRHDLLLGGYNRTTTRLWVTPDDYKNHNHTDYVTLLETNCLRFRDAVAARRSPDQE